MKTLYLDLISGISGDMFVGALLDLGVDYAELERQLARLNLAGYHLHQSRRTQRGITGTKFDVHLEADLGPARATDPNPSAGSAAEAGHIHGPHTEPAPPHSHERHPEARGHPGGPGPHAAHRHAEEEHRDFAGIRQLITASALSPWVKERAIATFARLAAAEGKIHGLPPERVHFHEVGAIDSMVDIVGAAVALECLGQPRVLASHVVDGTGWVHCAHGRLPVPTPATLEILAARGIQVSQCEEPHELVTPTGAALLAEFVAAFGPMPALVLERVGYGLGTRENRTRPNVLRAVLAQVPGVDAPAPHDWETDQVAVIESNLDDVSGERLGHFMERALAAGALDVCYAPIQMKKSRPGVLLTLLCAGAEADRFCEMILRETSAFGVRRTWAERRKLRRRFETVRTRFGEVTLKLGWLDDRVVQVAPEFESCRTLAAGAAVPIQVVYEAALQAYAGRTPDGQPA